MSLRRAVLALTLVVAACAPRPAAQFGEGHPDAMVQKIYVATEHELDNLGPQFGQTRPDGVRFLSLDVSVPAGHELGNIEWPKGKKADAATDFVMTDSRVYRNARQMAGAINANRKGGGNETLVYVHGYNVTFSDAVYRFAQIQTDFESQEPGVVYSWLSAGDARGYAYDRDSVLYSRDDFERVLNALTVETGGRVVILAHSMGSQLVMETLRQAAIRGNRGMLNRINGVAFISPDIDPGVFRSQAEAIGKLPDPFVIFVSQEDKALSLSSLLTGQKKRLGVIDSADEVAGLGVSVLDFTELGDGKGLGHSTAVTSPAAISVLKGIVNHSDLRSGSFNDYVVLKKPK